MALGRKTGGRHEGSLLDQAGSEAAAEVLDEPSLAPASKLLDQECGLIQREVQP
jgi:hypothetical protein